MGNPYTYVANNPGSFVDPFGEERWGAQSYLADMADVGYGYFIAAPVGAITGTASALWHYDKTIQGIRSLAVGLTSDPLGTVSGLVSGFVAQFEDTDATGQAVFEIVGTVASGFAAAPKLAPRVGVMGDKFARQVGTETASASKLVRAGEQLEFDFAPPSAPLDPGALEVGTYKDLTGKLAGFDAHHVGQQSVMKQLVSEYNATNAPAILVPKIGHTQRGVRGIISRDSSGISNIRQLIARDIMELRRVYPEIPNKKLQKLIEMNKTSYPRYMRKNK